MIAGIFSTGTELTRGELNNSNACWLAGELTQLDASVLSMVTVDDDRLRIADAFVRLSMGHDVIVCTGGLGPTTDDLTAEALAMAAGVSLVTDETSLEAIRSRLERFGRPLTESNAKQARVPEGSSVLPNHAGTAPGFSLKLNRATIYCLPGVPSEMKAMFEASVKPDLLRAQRTACTQIVIRTFGMPESAVNDALAGVEERYGISLGYRVHFPELAVKVVALRPTLAESRTLAEAAAGNVREILGKRVVFGEGDATLPSVLAQALRSRGERLGCAESCTGGAASALITEQSGVSDVFVGSIIAYSNAVKHHVLGVSNELLERHGAVSQEVALAMAEGARKTLGCEWSLAITGIAGPTGETPGKPVGTVHLAVAGPNLLRHHQRIIRWDRNRVQRAAAFVGLNWIRCLLDNGGAEPL